MALKTLGEFNEDRRAHWLKQYEPPATATGIACPTCGEELHDTNPSLTLTSMPPQKNVGCHKCGYRGYRIA